jgi:DNA-binding transcriptional LysR family regulator
MHYDDVRYFLALARHGAVRPAGADLGVSHSTVARRVEALESQLGTRLFDRRHDGYHLTEAGRRVRGHAEEVEAAVHALQRSVVGYDERLEGRVSVTTCDPYVASLVLEALGPFLAEHPGIDLRLDADGRRFDLSRREADLAIRAKPRGAPPPDELVGRIVAPLRMGAFVARDHAHRLDPALGGTEARWLGMEDPELQRRLLASTPYADLPIWGCFSEVAVVERAALQGLGLLLLPTYMGDAMPGMRRLLDDDLGHLGDLWLLYHPDLRTTARVAAVRRCLTEAFAANQARFHRRSSP